MNPDTTIRRTAPQMITAGLVAAGASTMLNRTNTLVNGYSYGWGNRTPSMFHHDKDNVNGTVSIREPASHMTMLMMVKHGRRIIMTMLMIMTVLMIMLMI